MRSGTFGVLWKMKKKRRGEGFPAVFLLDIIEKEASIEACCDSRCQTVILNHSDYENTAECGEDDNFPCRHCQNENFKQFRMKWEGERGGGRKTNLAQFNWVLPVDL